MSGQIVTPNLTLQTSDNRVLLGAEHVTNLGSVYKYVKASEAITQYDCCIMSDDGHYTINQCDTDDSQQVAGWCGAAGFAQIAFTNAYYGWLFVGGGSFTGSFAASCVGKAVLYATSTAGVVDDAASESVLMNAWLVTTITSATTAPGWSAGRIFFGGIAS